MERRSFLALLAAAPIAALAPLPKFLDLNKQFSVPMDWSQFPPPSRVVDREIGIAIRYVKQWDIIDD